jgi:hypothetical protein
MLHAVVSTAIEARQRQHRTQIHRFKPITGEQQARYKQIHCYCSSMASTDTAIYAEIQNTVVLAAFSASQIQNTLRNQPYREKVSGSLNLTNTRWFSGMLNSSVEPVLPNIVAIMSAPGGGGRHVFGGVTTPLLG